jgi:hypothetical protein
VPVFRLDEEQRSRVRDCLRKPGLAPSSSAFDRFVRAIEGTIAGFVKPNATPRETHDELRALWFLAHEDDPQIGVLRARTRALSKNGREYINRRFTNVVTRLSPGYSTDAAFLAWVESADGNELVRALRIVTAEGGKHVVGRSRGGGKRSGPRLEPVIFGEVRGAGPDKRKGGRLREDGRHELVMKLGLHWLHATGQMPKPGRSSETAFGALVHSVFQWLEIPDEAATYALRRYWAEVKRGLHRPSLAVFLRRHGEEL